MKKGQEEVVGFILIIILVAVAFLIFLGLSLRQTDTKKFESKDIHQLLESIMEYTSECAIGYIPAYARVRELFRECNAGGVCLEGGDSCQALNRTLTGIINNSISAGAEGPVKGYLVSGKYILDESSEEIISLSEGNCEGDIYGAEYVIPESLGKINVRLEVCY